MRAIAVAMVAVLLGCATTRPLPVVALDERTGTPEPQTALPAEVMAACALLHTRCKPARVEWGAVTVSILPAPGAGIGGRALKPRGCLRYAWSDPHPKILAHELGHLLGLRHVKDPARLMHHVPGQLLSRAELRRMRTAAGVLAACRLGM